MNEFDKRMLSGITSVEKAKLALEEVKGRVSKIRDYTYMMPPRFLLGEVARVLEGGDVTEEVKVMFARTVLEAVLNYLNL